MDISRTATVKGQFGNQNEPACSLLGPNENRRDSLSTDSSQQSDLVSYESMLMFKANLHYILFSKQVNSTSSTANSSESMTSENIPTYESDLTRIGAVHGQGQLVSLTQDEEIQPVVSFIKHPIKH